MPRSRDSSHDGDTGVCEENTPPDKQAHGNISLKSTKSGAGLQFLLLDCRIGVRVKGVFCSQMPVWTRTSNTARARDAEVAAPVWATLTRYATYMFTEIYAHRCDSRMLYIIIIQYKLYAFVYVHIYIYIYTHVYIHTPVQRCTRGGAHCACNWLRLRSISKPGVLAYLQEAIWSHLCAHLCGSSWYHYMVCMCRCRSRCRCRCICHMSYVYVLVYVRVYVRA